MDDEKTIKGLIAAETALRRTFAIISHPDAGKTTLTEKLLLYAGMIRTAGMVHGRKTAKHVSSDWMAMERERGISITSSAMQFRYKGVVINVLDTPGHQDFSEDTYRTLTAADSAVMVIDAGKGVEAQTRKLFAVCRMRNTPILTFINKMDMPGREPLSLLSEVEDVLKIHAAPVNWPIGSGRDFCGVVDLRTEEVILFDATQTNGAHLTHGSRVPLSEINESHMRPDQLSQLKDDLALIAEAGNKFDLASFLAGKITPVFFGSALTNFGIEPFFDSFAALAPCPKSRPATESASGAPILIDPVEEGFAAYVFKIQANMNPRHRDSMAFLRVCAGRFERDLMVKHGSQKKEVRLSRSHSMFGGERTTLDVAYPGDIIGVVNPGQFAIGDTVSERGGFNFQPMPRFSPEVVAELRPLDAGRKKAFDKGVQQLSDEGAILVLKTRDKMQTRLLIAAVGQLQFEVIQYRLANEYGVRSELSMLPFKAGAWLKGDPASFALPSGTMLAEDQKGQIVFLYSLEWERRVALERNIHHQLLDFVQ